MIKIENENLAKVIMFNLDKLENSFSLEELSTINELMIDNVDMSLDYSIFEFKVLELLPNLRELEIANFDVSLEDLKYILELKFLKALTFDRCKIFNPEMLKDAVVTSLSFIQTEINDYQFLSHMNIVVDLSVIGKDFFDLNYISNLRLTSLQLSNTYIEKIDLLNNFESLENLYIDNTNIIGLNFLNELKKLKNVGLDENQITNNEEVIKELTNRGVIIHLDALLPIGGDLE